jgi:hypothetical protein
MDRERFRELTMRLSNNVTNFSCIFFALVRAALPPVTHSPIIAKLKIRTYGCESLLRWKEGL